MNFISSDAYDSDEIVVKWNGPNPVDVNPEIRMPDMRLRYILPTLRNDTYATGIWSCALAEFHVDREIMHHIIQVRFLQHLAHFYLASFKCANFRVLKLTESLLNLYVHVRG
ncbi:unnamed protein product [Cylicostephanus goldi]|uniref:Uncharacterized protein n=1 Tax=Cylicostephanus goldi TaxID=71465 RepID=A0A3P6SGR5_CYLGO|nr:unnamed protein product [Cylicostephanus goldi]